MTLWIESSFLDIQFNINKIQFQRQLQYLILKGLTPKKRAVNSKGCIVISKKVYDDMRVKGLTGRFKIQPDLLEDLDLVLYQDQSQHCLTTPQHFKVRVGRQKNIKDGRSNKWTNGSFIFSFEFIRFERV